MSRSISVRLAEVHADDPRSDDDLVTSVLAGDPAGFAVLVRRYNQRIFRVVRAILRDDYEAEDVVQQAHLRAYHRLSQFRGEAAYATWVTQIAVHEALGRMRTSKRRGDLGILAPELSAGAQEARRTPEDDASARELGRLLEQHIDALPEGYRSVFVMRDVEELSTAETATCLGITEEAVRVRLHRARHMLNESLTTAMGPAAVHAFRFDGDRCLRTVRLVLGALGIVVA